VANDVVAAYEAPFSVPESKAALRGLPMSVPRLASRIDHRIDHVIPDAGHGLQEDQGLMIGELIAEWLLGGR
jgi:pimeloyl-ACP methyl ester carboxylesterase